MHELRGFAERIELKPLLLGALFRDIGTPNAPALAMTQRERDYGAAEMERWRRTAGVSLEFNRHFPIRTVLALRVCIADCRTVDCLFRAAWQKNVNVGDEEALCAVLDEHGFDGRALIAKAKGDAAIKKVLRANTELARTKGLFGVPTYVVNGDYERFVWGGHRVDFVKDLCCGWKPECEVQPDAKL